MEFPRITQRGMAVQTGGKLHVVNGMQLALSEGMAVIPVRPAHPERICWGCPRYCSAEELGCAGGTIRTPHPIELFGDDWQEFFGEAGDQASGPADSTRD